MDIDTSTVQTDPVIKELQRLEKVSRDFAKQRKGDADNRRSEADTADREATASTARANAYKAAITKLGA